MRFLVETNVLSELRHPQGDPQVKERFRRIDEVDLFTSAIVFGELAKGVASLPAGKRKDRLNSWLEQFEAGFGDRILPLDREVAKMWGQIVAACQAEGAAVGVSDGQIAATAVFHDLVVITRNGKHFQHTRAKIWNIWENDFQA